MKSNTNGKLLAFPRSGFVSGDGDYIDPGAEGMELRDIFAMSVMQGLVASGWTRDDAFEKRAAWAYIQADIMVAMRDVETPWEEYIKACRPPEPK